MSPRLTKSQLDKLGDRLRKAEEPAEDDLRLLQDYVLEHASAVEYVRDRIRNELGLVATPRLKTLDTLIDKLKRDKSRLSGMQDVAGVRIAAVPSLDDQDRVVRQVCGVFDHTRVSDRRAKPSSGYRAVHVIVEVEELRVEVQVRTVRQDLWAQVFERLGDRWGRQIRYGGQPDDPEAAAMEAPSGAYSRADVCGFMKRLAKINSDIEELELEASRTDDLTEHLRDSLVLDAEVADVDSLSAEATTLLRVQIERLAAEHLEMLRFLQRIADEA